MNPIISRKGVCDPHIHIFDGKAYMYATHDNFRPQGGFEMTEWGIWSSDDLIHWSCEQILRPEDFYCGPIDQCWAVDAAKQGDRYYWYFSVGADAVGVGVSDSPAGPFHDALGHELVGPDTPPVNVHKWDPCVFRDDDGEYYLICGSCINGDEYQMARLNKDMRSLAEPLRSIPYSGNPSFEDKATIHKYNGRYYLSHASFYAVADNVYGPYTYCGSTRANIDHNSFFTYHEQTYQSSGGMDNPNQYFRSSFLTYCHYRRNGEIAADMLPTVYGVGQYDANWERIEAEWFFDCHNAVKQERSDGGFEIAMAQEGGWLYFPNVCHLSENMEICVKYSNEGEETVLEIREDAPNGRLMGQLPLMPCSDAEDHIRLENSDGHHNLYLVVCGGKVTVDWFALESKERRFAAETHRGALTGGAEVVAQQGAAAGLGVRMCRSGDGVTLTMDGAAGGSVLCKLRYAAAEPALVSVRVGEQAPFGLELPATGRGVDTFSFSVEMAPGVNAVTIFQDANDLQELVLDSLYTEVPETIFRSYPAALGDFEPFGNGIWDGLPQREWNADALGGCFVSNLKKAGYRVFLKGIDGGETGAEVQLQIHYRNTNAEPVHCRATVNGTRSQQLCLHPAKGDAIQKACCAIWLRPGNNELSLTIEEDSDTGVCLSAFSVVPKE